MDHPWHEDAVVLQRELLRARGDFARAVERAGSAADAVHARRGWAAADLQLARWALERGKSRGLLEGDDEDLFRSGLAYAREGLSLADVDPSTSAELERVRAELERELATRR